MARYWGQQKEESLTTVGGGSENLQGVSASDRKRWDGKQDQLVFDNKPTRGSVNVLNSDAVARAFEEFKDAISTAYKQYLNTQVTSYAEMVTAVTNAKNDVDNAYAAIEKYETNMRVLYEDTLSKLTDAQNILAGATTLLNKTNTESSALSAKIKQLESVHSSIISDLDVLRNALANVENDTDHANARIEELISKANEVDVHVASLVKIIEDALTEIETEKEDTLAKIRAVRDSIPDDYEKVCEDIKEVRQELIDARRRGTWITSETVSGETVHAADCAPITPLGLRLFGKGEQRQYEGNQLFDADNIVKRVAESVGGIITITADSSKLYDSESVTDLYLAGGYNGTKTLFELPQGNYVIGCGDSNVRITMYPNVDIGSIDTINSSHTLSTDCSIIGIRVRSIDGNSLLGRSFTIMLNEGNTLKPWEPFVGNEPSPNMNYSQKPEFLGESGSIGGKVFGGNVYDSSYRNSSNSMYGMNGSPTEASGVFKITASGTDICVWGQADKGQNYNAYVHGYLGVIPNNATEISVTLTNEKFVKSIVSFYDTDKIAMDWHGSGNKNKFTIQIPEGAKYFSLRFGNGSAVVGETYETSVMVNFGQPMDYEPYTEQPFTFLTPNGLRGIPLGKTIPDAIKNSPIHMSGVYWDGEQYQIADTENENGKDVQRIGTAYINANTPTSSMLQYQDVLDDYAYVRFWKSIQALHTEVHCICSHAPSDLKLWNKNKLGCWVSGASDIDMTFPYSVLGITKDVTGDEMRDAVKAWLEDNTITVYYVIAEPIITDTTEEEKAQLDNLVMNYPNTTIVNDEGAYMEVEYGKDAEAYINENYTPRSEHEALEQRVKIIEEEIIKL